MSDVLAGSIAVSLVASLAAVAGLLVLVVRLLGRAHAAELGRMQDDRDRWKAVAGARLERQQELERDNRDLATRGQRMAAASRARGLALADPDDDRAFERVLHDASAGGDGGGTLAAAPGSPAPADA